MVRIISNICTWSRLMTMSKDGWDHNYISNILPTRSHNLECSILSNHVSDYIASTVAFGHSNFAQLHDSVPEESDFSKQHYCEETTMDFIITNSSIYKKAIKTFVQRYYDLRIIAEICTTTKS